MSKVELTDAEVTEAINRFIPGFRWRDAKFEIHPNALRAIVAGLMNENYKLNQHIIVLEETLSGRTMIAEEGYDGQEIF